MQAITRHYSILITFLEPHPKSKDILSFNNGVAEDGRRKSMVAWYSNEPQEHKHGVALMLRYIDRFPEYSARIDEQFLVYSVPELSGQVEVNKHPNALG